MTIAYAVEPRVSAEEFVDVLRRSGLAAHRPVDQPDRIAKMLAHANLFVTARDGGKLVGIARSLTDFAYCCYLSDLAVDRAYQGQGIGRELIERTRAEATANSMVLLISAPDSVGFYEKIGMPRNDRAFMYPRVG